VLAGTWQPVQLNEPGSYLIRGWLPSGQQLTATFDSEMDEAVILRAPGTAVEPDTYGQSLAEPPGLTGSMMTWALVWAQQAGRWQPAPTSVMDLSVDGVSLTIPATSSGSAIMQVGGALATLMTVIPAKGTARVSVQQDQRSGTSGWKWRVDASADAGIMLLDYLENGDLKSARILTHAFLDMDLPTWANATPLLAAAAGYVLLRTGDHDKLCALVNRFDHALDGVPDGAVIRAWHQLHEQEPALRDVWDLLQPTATELPIASEGLRLLHHGLALLTRQRPDKTIHSAFERIRLLAACVALQADPLTAFNGRVPWEPSMAPIITSPADAGDSGHHAEEFLLSGILRDPAGLIMRWTDKVTLSTYGSGGTPRLREPRADPRTAPSRALGIRRPDRPHPSHVLTWRQRKVLQVIRESVQKRGYPPSMREIGDAVGLTSTSSVSYQLSILQKKGYLQRDVGRPRTVEVRLPGHPAVRPEPRKEEEEAGDIPGIDIPSQEAAYVPLVGRIAAGEPLLAEEPLEDVFPLPRQLVGEGDFLIMEFVGDSMIDAAIRDGDWIVVRRQPDGENGDIVAALIDGEPIIKTFKRSSDHVWLISHNPVYAPILGDDATILGKVVAVMRRV
jgi:repressor LexA